MNLDWAKSSNAIMEIYRENKIEKSFKEDEAYLAEAYEVTEKFWHDQFRKIEDVRVIMISEAPLFGPAQTYIYNPESKPTAFFYYQDLKAFESFDDVVQNPKTVVEKKQIMFDQFAKNGFLVIDIFPFALNPGCTAINFRKMNKRTYNQLLKSTLDCYLLPKLRKCLKKCGPNPQFIYRYKRLLLKTGPQINAAIQEVIPKNQDLEMISINGTNMSLDRMKLTEMMKRPFGE